MPKRFLNPAKITRPEVQRALLRPRLFAALDACRDASVVWLEGPPGAGKTVLISSYLKAKRRWGLWVQLDRGDADLATFFHYLAQAAETITPRHRKALPKLTHEYLLGIEAYARRFGEALSERLPKGSVVVLDNYEQVSKEAPLHALLPALAESLGPAVQLLALSRESPPPPLARLRVHGSLMEFGSATLALTLSETSELVARNPTFLTPNELLAETEGWVAGVVLLLAQEQPSSRRPKQVLFDYFAAEFFSTLPRAIQEGLVQSALLPAMTGEQILALSGQPALINHLRDFQRRNYFVTERPDESYEYHPLFREFLLSRAPGMFAQAWWHGLQCKAARLLDEAGQSEAAARLYGEAGEHESLAALLLKVAPQWLDQGRYVILERHLQSLSPVILGVQPWLRFWHGRALVVRNPLDAYTEFLQAFVHFKRLADPLGLYSTWAALLEIHALIMQFDVSLEDRYQEYLWLREQYPDFPTVELELQVAAGVTVIACVKGDYALLETWATRCEAWRENDTTPTVVVGALLQVAVALSWVGQVGRGMRLLSGLDVVACSSGCPASMQIQYLLACANVWICSGDRLATAAFVSEAAKQMETTGLGIYAHCVECHRLLAGLIAGDTAMAARESFLLQQIPPAHTFLKALVACWEALHRVQLGEHALALGRMQDAMAMIGTTVHASFQRYLRILYAWLHLLHGDDGQAEILFLAMQASDSTNADPFTAPLLAMAEADRAYRQGRETDGDCHLQHALAQGRTGDYAVWSIMGPQVVGPLYQRALRCGFESDFVRVLVRRADIAAPDPADPDWPWPVRITTFGHFEVTIEGQPLRFQRKAQQKPLDLLKALIAQGGQDVSETGLMQQLWPDSEGDAGISNLRTTLHRLRNLLQHEEALSVDAGRLSLNRRRVWVDSLALGEATRQLPTVPTPILQRLAAAYTGPFLKGETVCWSLIPRNQLRTQFLRLVEHLGDRLERDGMYQAAIDSCLNALQSEPLAEPCYYRLMQLYVRLDRRAEALDVYQRCRQALLSELDCSPSKAVQSLHDALREQRP